MSQITPLSEIMGYGELVSTYEKNKNKNWKEWLNFDKIFDKPGKQGLVGLLSIKTDDTESNNSFSTVEGTISETNSEIKDKQIIFKMSQYINYLIQHESTVMGGLNDLSGYCPHFCKLVGNILCEVDPKSGKTKNPFNSEAKYKIKKETMLCEYIDKSCKFYNYIRSDKISEDVLYSTIKQVLLAISIAQKKKQFTHYDLHSFNIMMKKCNQNVVFLYVLDEENQFAIPTHGHYPVIIDFGFSYINDMEDGPLWASMGHTEVGFMSDRFDWVADPKLFLITVSGEIKEKRNTKKSHKLRRIVRNLFNNLTVDWSSGWDIKDEQSASDYILDIITPYNPGSCIFNKYEHYCMDLLQSLIILPLEEQDFSEIHKTYKIFITEFINIENQISSPFYNLYILKGIIDAARYVRAGYLQKNTRIDSIRTFRLKIIERVNEVANFCKLDNIHYEKMLCALLIFSKCMEGMLYKLITKRMKQKEQEYNKLPLKSIEQIYAGIETNLSDDYIYNQKTTIFVFDSLKENTGMLQLTSEQIRKINEIHPLCRGTSLYDIYKGIAPI